MAKTYIVTYEIVTQESAEAGDVAEFGDVCETSSLAEAFDALSSTRTCEVDGVESYSGSFHNGRLVILVNNSMEFRTGAYESRCLHLHGVTESSAKRIAKVAGITLN